MLQSFSLDGIWKVRGFDGVHGDPGSHLAGSVMDRGYMDAQVPGEVHLDLERNGLIPDCRISTNAQSARWVEEQVWVYRKSFMAPGVPGNAKLYLVFDGLDLVGNIYLNGEHIGSHANFFTPCRIDISSKLQPGENLLAVRIESGLYSVSDKSASSYTPAMDSALHKRCWQRKPQCQFSWDWNPRLINVGIWKSVRLEWTQSARIDAVTVYPDLSADHSYADLHVLPFIDNTQTEEVEAEIVVKIKQTGESFRKQVKLQPGIHRYECSLRIDQPKLWWPINHGDQHLYDVEVEVKVDGQTADSASRRTGIRSVEIFRGPHPVEGNYFIVKINGRLVFAKGGNWVPADILYARVTPEKYSELVDLAVQANFNMLRIWGGGLYTDHALLDACDEKGVMVWHDFIFACSGYPVEDTEFFENVKEEIVFNVRDLSPHPSLVIWCGNNEVEWGDWDWGSDQYQPHSHYHLFHSGIPRLLLQEDPSRPYWPSSPYSEDFKRPNDPTTGDQHPWHVSLGENTVNFWAYRHDVSRFPNEGGFLGASTPATIDQFLPESQRSLYSPGWEYHDNACNYGPETGICYMAIKEWLNVQPEDLEFYDYLFYSSIIQSEGLQEYINNFRRRMFSTSCAIFWMYNDSWPQSHGWTIVDYYLRKKLCYHPVRRAFAPVHAVAAIDQDRVNIYGINENQSDWQGKARFGLFQTSGGLPIDQTVEAHIPGNTSKVLASINLEDWQNLEFSQSGVFALLFDDSGVLAQNRLLNAKYCDIAWKDPCISVRREGPRAIFAAESFAWAVCIETQGEQEVSDNCFDLIPGVEYAIAWPENLPLPEVARHAAQLLLGK